MDGNDSYALLHDIVDLSSHHLGPDSSSCIEAALDQKLTAITLDLGWNTLGDDGAVALAGLLARPGYSRFTTLDLWSNSIGPEGGKALARLLRSQHCRLTSINLRKNHVGHEGAVAILKALWAKPGHGFTSLDLTMNEIEGSPEAKALLAHPLTATDLIPTALNRLLAALGSDPELDNSLARAPLETPADDLVRLDHTAISVSSTPIYEGADSAVFKGQRWAPDRSSSEDVAVKAFGPTASDAAVAQAVQRSSALRSCSHFVGVCERSAQRCIVTSWAAVGPLSALHDKTSPCHAGVMAALAPLYRRVRVCLDVGNALRDLHETHGVLHTRLQPRAVLIDHRHRARLASLRHTVPLADPPPASPPPPGSALATYSAPELLEGHRYSVASDTYGFGILCFELLGSPSPSSGAFIRPRALPSCPADIGALLGRCVGEDPLGRPTLEAVLTPLRAWLKALLAAVSLPGTPQVPISDDGDASCGLFSPGDPAAAHHEEAEPRSPLSHSLLPRSRSRPLSFSHGRTSSVDSRRVLTMSLPLGSVPGRRASTSRQLSERSSGRLSDAEIRLLRDVQQLTDRVDDYEEQLSGACARLPPLEGSAAQVQYFSTAIGDLYAKLGALEHSMRSNSGDLLKGTLSKDASTATPEEVTFLELNDRTLQKSFSGTEALSVEGLVKSLVRLEVEKVEQGFRDRIEAIETMTSTQFQRLSSRQQQLESHLSHLSSRPEPTKGVKLRLPCETQLTELQGDVTALRTQLQEAVDRIQADLLKLTRRPPADTPSVPITVFEPEILGASHNDVDGSLLQMPSLKTIAFELPPDPGGGPGPTRTFADGMKVPSLHHFHLPDLPGPTRLPMTPLTQTSLGPCTAPTRADYTVDRTRWLQIPLSARTDGVVQTNAVRIAPQAAPPGAPPESPGRVSARSTVSAGQLHKSLAPLVHKRSGRQKPRPPEDDAFPMPPPAHSVPRESPRQAAARRLGPLPPRPNARRLDSAPSTGTATCLASLTSPIERKDPAARHSTGKMATGPMPPPTRPCKSQTCSSLNTHQR